MKQAAIYCRVGDVERDQHSLNLQEASCRDYCEQHEYRVAVIKRELASGAGQSRPQLREIEAFARTGEIDVVVIQASDQLSVTPDGIAFWERVFGRWGATVEFVQGGAASGR
jgi:DNA invertase Pin-like site-specific DNA recombinase